MIGYSSQQARRPALVPAPGERNERGIAVPLRLEHECQRPPCPLPAEHPATGRIEVGHGTASSVVRTTEIVAVQADQRDDRPTDDRALLLSGLGGQLEAGLEGHVRIVPVAGDERLQPTERLVAGEWPSARRTPRRRRRPRSNDRRASSTSSRSMSTWPRLRYSG